MQGGFSLLYCSKKTFLIGFDFFKFERMSIDFHR
jgi:hypothetical protein